MTARPGARPGAGIGPAAHGVRPPEYGPPGSGALHPQAQRHWQLYTDWCQATGRAPMPADAETLAEFVRQCPAARTMTVQRLDASRLMHERSGVPFAPLGDGEAPLPWRTGDHWLELPEALACVPTVGWVRGFTGRRDGFILVAAGELGLSRNRIRRLTAKDITAGPGHTAVLGTVVSRAGEPGECPACAVTRWLDVLGRYERDWRGGVRQHLALAQPSSVHACDVPPTPGWEKADTLIPGIDRYGWTSAGLALSTRTISTVLATRQNPDQAPRYRDEPPVPGSATVRPSRQDPQDRHGRDDPDGRDEPDGLDERPPQRTGYQRELFDDITEMLDALDAKVAAALQETERVLATINGNQVNGDQGPR